MRSSITTRNASAYPWRNVTSSERHYLTGAERFKQNSRLYLKLECGHEITRKGSARVPGKVRCTLCSAEGVEATQ